MIASIVASIVIGIGFAKMPYGYYLLLRWVVCGVCCWYAYHAHEKRILWLMWTLIAFAVIYNPVIRFHLGRDTWEVVNVITIPMVLLAGKLASPRASKMP